MVNSLILEVLKIVFTNKKVAGWVYVIAVTVTCGVMFFNNMKINDENRILTSNQEALLSDIERYKTENDNNAVKVRQLELTAKEYKKLFNENEKTIEDLELKVKRLKHLNKTATQTVINTTTYLRDTVIVDRVVGEEAKARAFEWKDGWNRISGVVYKDSVDCSYEGSDTLTVACVKVPKKFLFFRFGCKHVEVHVTNRNKSSNIIYNTTVAFR